MCATVQQQASLYRSLVVSLSTSVLQRDDLRLAQQPMPGDSYSLHWLDLPACEPKPSASQPVAGSWGAAGMAREGQPPYIPQSQAGPLTKDTPYSCQGMADAATCLYKAAGTALELSGVCTPTTAQAAVLSGGRQQPFMSPALLYPRAQAGADDQLRGLGQRCTLDFLATAIELQERCARWQHRGREDMPCCALHAWHPQRR